MEVGVLVWTYSDRFQAVTHKNVKTITFLEKTAITRKFFTLRVMLSDVSS